MAQPSCPDIFKFGVCVFDSDTYEFSVEDKLYILCLILERGEVNLQRQHKVRKEFIFILKHQPLLMS